MRKNVFDLYDPSNSLQFQKHMLILFRNLEISAYCRGNVLQKDDHDRGSKNTIVIVCQGTQIFQVHFSWIQTYPCSSVHYEFSLGDEWSCSRKR